ncbi:hypothetical protein ACT6QH_13485 [Xanthobacter sp. TB0139]|uniref:hypothetical protein n=1 Tax=Xanthobacter sp. TB0139 TaxID=3459178 RepID=UPI00403A6579
MPHTSRETATRAASAHGASSRTEGQAEEQGGLTGWERDRVRRRALALWWEDGCPQWRGREHWAQAQLQMLKRYPRI